MANDLRVIFYSKGGLMQQEVTTDTPHLLLDVPFTKAECRKGECIIYPAGNYNQYNSGGDYKILKEGQGAVDITAFSPRSVRRVTSFGTESVTLYEHTNFGGRALTVGDHVMNVDLGNGVSSLIVSGGRWVLYTRKDFKGANRTVDAGHFSEPKEMGFPNDTLRSIKQDD